MSTSTKVFLVCDVCGHEATEDGRSPKPLGEVDGVAWFVIQGRAHVCADCSARPFGEVARAIAEKVSQSPGDLLEHFLKGMLQ